MKRYVEVVGLCKLILYGKEIPSPNFPLSRFFQKKTGLGFASMKGTVQRDG
jgi:hypothetical protein